MRKGTDPQDRFGLISEESLTGIFIHRGGVITHVNRRLLEMVGYAPEQAAAFLGRPVLDFVHPDDCDLVRQRMVARLNGAAPPAQYELRLKTATGGTLWVEILASAIDQDGQPAVMAHLVDVTERRRAIELLRLQYALSNALTGANDLDAALQLTLDAVMQIESVDGGAIYLADPKTGGLEMRVHRGLFASSSAAAERYGPDDPQTLAVRDGKPIYDERQPADVEDGPAAILDAPKALAVIPITHRGEVVAVVDLASRTSDTIPRLAREALEAMSARLGAVIVRARAEAALRESEARFRALSDASFGGIGIHEEGRIIDVNAALAALVGYAPEELIGMDPLRLIAPESHDAARRYALGGSEEPWEATVVRKDGSRFAAEMRGRSIPYQGRQVRVAEMRDITERKRAEAALRRAEFSIQHAVVPTHWLRPDGTFIRVNDALCRQLGYTQDELLRLTVADVDPDLTPAEWRALWDLLRREKARVFERRHRRKNGELVPVELTSCYLEYDGEEYSIVFGVDLSSRRAMEEERARLEAQLQQAQKLEAVGRLAGGVAHDFNNVLTTVLVTAEVLAAGLPAGDAMRADLVRIKQAAERAAKLTEQLLAFSRRQIIAPRVIDLNATVQQSMAMWERLIGEDITLQFAPAAALGRVKADPGQIEQALVNLVANAREAMPNGGRLVVETANVRLDEDYCRVHPDAQSGEWVMLAVSDTGVGLSEESRAHLFEPFFSTKPDRRGAGLGLPMVYGAVRQNGGFINVYSELNVGSTFKLYFPRIEAPAQQVARAADRELPPGQETILLVEDEEVVRELAVRVLERRGYVVLPAAGSDQALELWRQRGDEIALLVTDVVMPGLNGRQLYERLRAERPGLRALYMSGYTENVIAHHGVLDEGANFLQKPFTVEGLSRAVRAALDA